MSDEQLHALLALLQPAHGRALFPGEGEQFYGAAYQHNAPFAQGAPYRTMLSPLEEAHFQQWLQSTGNPGRFNPGMALQDYDMRGYWKEQVLKGRNLTGINPADQQLHFPDLYKTPYDTTFSAESKYAKPGTPFQWWGNNLIDLRTGQLIMGGQR